MSEHTYHLQKYAGTSTRHTCPQCGHKGEFTYYVDERNVPIDESCGRCNRERCGYHLTPSEYFKAHPADKRNEFTTWKQPEPPKAIPISYLPSSLLATDTHRDRNNLFQFMSKEFGDVEANRVFDLYHVGTSRHWRNNDGLSTTFPQINEKGKLCQLKVMAYNPNTGKRIHFLRLPLSFMLLAIFLNTTFVLLNSSFLIDRVLELSQLSNLIKSSIGILFH